MFSLRQRKDETNIKPFIESQILVKTQVFFLKKQLRHIEPKLLVNHFILPLLICFSEIINACKKINRIRIFLT